MPENPAPKIKPELSPPAGRAVGGPAYAELDVVTNFSFLRGASHPDELVYRAAEMGYRAVAVADVNTLAGIVRAHEAAKRAEIRLVVGSRLRFADGTPDVVVWCENRRGYANLCKLLTRGKRRAGKGECELYVKDLCEHASGLWAGVDAGEAGTEARRHGGTEGKERGPWAGGATGESLDGPRLEFASRQSSPSVPQCLRASVPLLLPAFGPRLSLLAWPDYGYDDTSRLARFAAMSRELGLPLLACNHVHYHDPSRRELQDVLTCVREKCTIAEAGYRLFPNAERCLKEPARMHRAFSAYPRALLRAVEVAEACTFSLDELRYEYPDEISPPGVSRTDYLRQLTEAGARERYPHGVPEKVRALIEHELRLIEQLAIEPYFLTVYDLVKFARSRGILCQGRGSAANSAVCYCIGITSVDPARIDLLFERFVSAARDEPPDIDVDFEHERREEVLQYMYAKYGRERCAMTAEVHTYRGRSAVRDVGKALGLGLDAVDRLAKRLDGWHGGTLSEAQVKDAGLDPADATVRRLLALTAQLLGFPRHLSQHVGGLVMTRTPLEEMCPIENAAMPGRTVLEWDKDDIDAVGMLKVDCLALGMLTALSRALGLLNTDKETKRQRDKGKCREERISGQDQHLQRPDRLAEGDGVERGDLSGYPGHAQVGTVRTDAADAAFGGFDPIEHRRGVREADTGGVPPGVEDRRGVIGRTRDAVGTGLGVVKADPAGRCDHRPVGRGGSNAVGSDVQVGSSCQPAEVTGADLPLCPFVSSSLCPSRAPLELHTIPPEDPATYDMICRADTVGVFQIESRAQMSMLPRLRPRSFYDLVIEVAIVRPGPIQGNMVHPYLRRRNGEEPVVFPSEALRHVLGKTLGVPLFQEQAMKVAMVAAGFSAEEADKLRRSMAAWRYNGAIETFRPRIVEGMLANGYDREFAERTFEQIKGFGEYGFPESHAASFALLVYASAWIKRHHPAAFCAALLNSQPMGFYAPAQLVRDAREHGVEVRGADVNASDWDCTLESRDKETEGQRDKGKNEQAGDAAPSTWGSGGPAVRLGLRMIRGIRQADAEALVATRRRVGRFMSVEHLHRATGLSRPAMLLLTEADAFRSLELSRRPATWDALAVHTLTPFDEEVDGAGGAGRRTTSDPPSVSLSLCHSVPPLLPPMPLGQEVLLDYATTGLSLKSHPVALVREQLVRERVMRNRDATELRGGTRVRVSGLVLVRQRPGTASGVVFMTLEDETGIANLIVRPPVWEKYRPVARHAGLLVAQGVLEKHSGVTHVMVTRMEDRSELLAGYRVKSRDFH